MRIGIIHLGDIHIKGDSDAILQHTEGLAVKIRSLSDDCDHIFVAVNGDIAFSGASAEYKAAAILFNCINAKFEEARLKFNWVISPGNHDCDFSRPKPMREIVISGLKNAKKPIQSYDSDTINVCCDVQKDFRKFRNSYEKFLDATISSDSTELHRTLSFNLTDADQNKIVITFNSINTSFCSMKRELMDMIPPKLNEAKIKSDISVAVLHHPAHWLQNELYKDFRKEVENESNVILTGHEHSQEAYLKDNQLTGKRNCFYLEGQILAQEKEIVGFQAIFFEINPHPKEVECEVKLVSWNKVSNQFEVTKKDVHKVKLKVDNSELGLTPEFESKLNDIGANFVSIHKQHLSLKDVYVLPTVLYINEKGHSPKIDSFEVGYASGVQKIIVTGEENYGKTSFLKHTFIRLFDEGKMPVYIDCSIDKTDYAKVEAGAKAVIQKCITAQYGDGAFSYWEKIDLSDKIILIDNLQDARFSNISHLLNYVSHAANTIVLTANDAFKVSVLLDKGSLVYESLKDYQRYELQAFGYRKRLELANRWLSLGNREKNNDFYKAVDREQDLMNDIVEKHYIPSLPLFLITILQSNESQDASDNELAKASYAEYFRYLVTRSLMSAGCNKDDLTDYLGYLGELAYFMSKSGLDKLLTEEDFKKFNKKYAEKYHFVDDRKTKLDLLAKANILSKREDTISFKYNYAYHYFLSYYLAHALDKGTSGIPEQVKQICANLHDPDNANTISFLIHHSAKPLILDEVIKSTSFVMPEAKPFFFKKGDMASLETLVASAPELVHKDVGPQKTREANAAGQDEFKEEPGSEQNDLSDVALAFRLVDMLGHLLRENASRLEKSDKENICTSVYELSMRLFGVLIDSIKENEEKFIKAISGALLDDVDQSSDREIEEAARQVLFSIVSGVSSVIVHKLSESVASTKLKNTFADMLEKYPESYFVLLVDINIKLALSKNDDQGKKQIPIGELQRAKETLSGSTVGITMLTILVIRQMCLFDVNHSTKQQIYSMFSISPEKQKQIEYLTNDAKAA